MKYHISNLLKCYQRCFLGILLYKKKDYQKAEPGEQDNDFRIFTLLNQHNIISFLRTLSARVKFKVKIFWYFQISCFSGDDQDLDDRVIRALWEENQQLRDQIQHLKSNIGDRGEEGKNLLQLGQDVCTAIRTLLGNFAVLLGDFYIQTIIWPWKSLKRKKEYDNFLALVFKISKLSLNMKSDKNSNQWNFFSVNILKISENSLKIRKKS